MRKTLILLAVIAAVATAVVATGAIGASAAPASDVEPWARHLDGAGASTTTAKVKGAERLVLHTRTASERFVDVDGNGRDSVGDLFLFTETFHDASGKTIGRDWVSCTLQFRQAIQCEATLLLFGRGTIEVAGTLAGNHDFVAVTGGTGEFADAGGELNAGQETRLVVHLLRLAK